MVRKRGILQQLVPSFHTCEWTALVLNPPASSCHCSHGQYLNCHPVRNPEQTHRGKLLLSSWLMGIVLDNKCLLCEATKFWSNLLSSNDRHLIPWTETITNFLCFVLKWLWVNRDYVFFTVVSSLLSKEPGTWQRIGRWLLSDWSQGVMLPGASAGKVNWVLTPDSFSGMCSESSPPLEDHAILCLLLLSLPSTCLGSHVVMAWTNSLLCRSFWIFCWLGKAVTGCVQIMGVHSFQLEAPLLALEFVSTSSLQYTWLDPALGWGSCFLQGPHPWNIQCQQLPLSYFFISRVATQLICK
jgi:hypothetical protein